MAPDRRACRLLVEGWRQIHHSYALVAQAHCLSLRKRGDVELRFRDIPYRDPTWQRTRGLLAAADEDLLAALPPPEPSFEPDVTLHMMPDFAPVAVGRKVTFGTPEFRVVPDEWRGVVQSGADLAPSVSVLTPSRWSAMAFERFGVPRERIHVVPHGVDPRVFRPDASNRAAMRNRLGYTDDDVVFMAVGAMTDNKGIALLLEAFAHVVERWPQARLVLKGADALFPSRQMLQKHLETLTAAARHRATNRITYLGDTLPAQDMAQLLRAADCYVSPYRAEGFNLPVLEAAACGVPVICTAGGPTDDFTLPAFARRIRSRPVQVRMNATQLGDALLADRDHLVALMEECAADRGARQTMGVHAAEHVARHYSWDAVTELLVQAIARP